MTSTLNRCLISTLSLSLLMLAMAGCDQSSPPNGGTSKGSSPTDGKKIQVAFVTNNVSPFWVIASAGIAKAEGELGDIKCEVMMPGEGGADEQKRIVEGLITRGVSGMAISPNDAEHQLDMIDSSTEAMNVITMDSDAPKSKRLCYVGTDNYKAGRVAGKLIKEAIPDGGKIMIFVGRMDAQNAIDRSNGIKDEIKDSNVELIDIMTDLTDRARAKQNVEDTLTKHTDVACLVGLWSYNGPQIIAAVKEANKVGQVKMVLFDEEEATLQGVADGEVYATVVQQPFEFGYQSVKVLRALAHGDKSIIPESKVIEVPVKAIKKENVKEFWDDLKAKTAGGK